MRGKTMKNGKAKLFYQVGGSGDALEKGEVGREE